MSAAVAAAAAAALSRRRSVTSSSSSVQNSHQYHHNHNHNHHFYRSLSLPSPSPSPTMSRYESQKRRDWNSFVQYIKNHHHPPLKKLSHIDGDHVVVFLRYLSQTETQTSFDALIGRLRVAFEENGGPRETNPFCSRVVKLYLEEVKNGKAKDSA